MACSYCGSERLFARGYCQACYYRLRRNGSVERRNVVNSGACSAEGCGRPAFSKNLCKKHYDQADHPAKQSWKLLRSRYQGQYPQRWDTFEFFLQDVGTRPTPTHQFRRKDPQKPWSVENSYWQERITPIDDAERTRQAQRERAWRFKTKFGITIEDYNRLLTEQNGVCAICQEPETSTHRTGKVRDLAVDHDHETGDVRGLLCTDCNTGLGLMNDSATRFRAAADYLDRHRKPRLICDNGEAA